MTSSKASHPIPSWNAEISEIKKRGNWDARLVTRYEGRARKKDYAQALSFEAHDPMWLLTRQWQFGRFQGNDCGTMVSSRVRLQTQYVDGICPGQEKDQRREIDRDEPWEPYVEAVPARRTLAVRVASGLRLRKFLAGYGKALAKLMELYPLEAQSQREEGDVIGKLSDAVNSKRTRFLEVYGGRVFDGVKAYEDPKLTEHLATCMDKFWAETFVKKYVDWFRKMYEPKQTAGSYWNKEKIAYDFSLTAANRLYSAENYASGKIGWYSFDVAEGADRLSPHRTESEGFIPVRASFPSAPARRLWEYEDRKVHFGNLSNDDVSQLASAVMMEYVSMYSNDWMIVPVEITPGSVANVDWIEVTDCFGTKTVIRKSAEQRDETYARVGPSVPFSDRWSLFGSTRAQAYGKNDFRSAAGLLFPSSLLRIGESEPIEQVQFMRDEMANMVWGVEERIDDECGNSLDGKTMSDKVMDIIDSEKGDKVEPDAAADFTYLVQNRVPVHWIPFIPEPASGPVGREIRFRRARMPLYYKDGFRWVRPGTSILGIERRGMAVKPYYLNEEEVLAYGTKVTFTAQRTRWTGGKSYLWYGYAKKMSGYQANSGLMFDELRAIDKGPQTLTATDQEPTPAE